ncbi:MAG: hypothetical protein RQ729_04900 [Wenzhouxiangellaceae bacterium]|nr:hypothetical protein [Wenzhouxiangellaceae bacterium]
MTLLALLIGLLVSLRVPELARLRRYDWLLAVPARMAGSTSVALNVALVPLIALLVGAAWSLLGEAVAGDFGQWLAGLLAILFCIGPRPLDRDLDRALADDRPDARQIALEHLLLREDADAVRAAAAVLHAALARWFGVVLWFALLGPAGCLAYRLVRQAHHEASLPPAVRAGLGRVIGWLNWPVMLLLLAAIGLMTDLDRVWQTVRQRPDHQHLPAALLDDVAAALGDADGDLAAGLRAGRLLAWRALTLWLVVISLLLLAGLIA